MADPTWYRNKGEPPIFTPSREGEPCPPDKIPAEEADNATVYVRLRNDREPERPWPIIGRPIKTNWNIVGSDFDIKDWRRA